ncbi:TIGR03808 family TAT-translocated repetitive protein [Aestuariivirga sp.]|uniref:TIGR03808 family TAT-translocated repetitive protein n=1 Tax=Aestuariivirga sp. TaxID=2650926 RepID=UPI0039E7087B
MTLARRSLLAGLAVTAAAPALAKSSDFKGLKTALEKAIQGDGVLDLPAGRYVTDTLELAQPLSIRGVPGRTILAAKGGGPLLSITGTAHVTLSGVTFDGGDAPPTEDQSLVFCDTVEDLLIENCAFINGKGSGLRLKSCAGRISGNRFSAIAQTALFSRNAKGLEISGNDVRDIGNNGIQVWTSESSEDGTIVSGNRVARIAAKAGGDGQNGNGINVYKAGNVIVANNRISDCAFSAVRNNQGSNCQITGNSISRTGEVAIYCEFGFEGAVVSGNLIADVAFGISITNFNEGGRLAVVSNNVVRNVSGGGTLPYTSAVGIGAEGDTQVTGNVVENAAQTGIGLGWGKYCRNLSATSNLVRNCGRGITFSVSDGAEPVMITNNRIAGSKQAAIQGMDQKEPVGPDLAENGGIVPSKSVISGNLVTA